MALAQDAAAKALALKKTDINRMLRDDKIEQPLFDDYFNKYLLPQFTAQPVTADTYPRLRKELKIFSNTAKGDSLVDFNKLITKRMKEIIASPNDSSAAKINAMLVIGELTEMSADNRPKPLGEGLGVLGNAVLSPKVRDEVKIAAMVGLERYAAAGAIPPGKGQDALSLYLLNLLKQKDPPTGRTPDGHNWMRRSAAQVLAKLGNPGPNNAVLTTMAEIAADPSARPTLRCTMAECIGQLKIPAGSNIDVRELANTIGHQALEICDAEIDRAVEEKRVPSRRLLMYAVYSARYGVEKLQSAAAGTPNSKFVAETAAKLKSLYQKIDDLETKDDAVVSSIEPTLDELRKTLGAKTLIAKQKDAVAAAVGKDKPVEPVKQ